jgi:urease accessory protein
MTTERAGLLRLQSWFSPAFPIGAYAYSHGLERAVEAGWVTNRASLIDWLDADLRCGAGRNDGLFFAESWRTAQRGDLPALLAAAELAAALRSTAEFALESAAQGTAFLTTIRKAWPHPFLDALAAELKRRAIPPVSPIATGAACAAHGVALDLALACYLQAWTANLISAGVRLVPLGQTDGQLAVAALEGAVLETAREALDGSLDDIGSAAFMADIASMQHETQYTRLFRS